MPTLKVREFSRLNTKAQDLRMEDSDMRLLINAEYEKAGSIRKVEGYTQQGDTLSAIISQSFTTEADWLGGTLSDTETSGDNLVLKGGSISQESYNDNHIVYGDNWIAQSFVATSTTVTKISLFLDKVLGSALQLYDDFDDNSLDTDKWNETGSEQDLEETGGKLRLYGYRVSGMDNKNTEVTTNNKTGASPAGEPIKGFKVDFSVNRNPGEAGSPQYYIRLTNGTDIIQIQKSNGTNEMSLSAAGAYGAGLSTELKRIAGSGGTVEVTEDGSDIKVYVNSVLQYTFSSVSVQADSYFVAHAAATGTILDSDVYLILDNVQLYANSTALADLDIRIEGDSSGPDGTAIANGTSTIDDAVVLEGSVSKIDATFSSPTTVASTTYWIVVKTSGGSSNNYYRLYKQNSDAYASGETQVSDDAGSSWGDDTDAPSDLAFVVYGSPASSGTWISSNITLASGQTASQIQINHNSLTGTETIARFDIVNTSNVVQSSYTTAIVSGSQTTLTGALFDSGLTFTNGNTFRVKVTLSSGGTATPVIESIIIDAPTKEITDLRAFYQSSGTRALIAVVAGTVKRLSSNVWATIKTGLTGGAKTDSTTFRAHKGTVIATGTASSGDLTSLTDDMSPEPSPNYYQGKMIKIVAGKGAGQVRVIQQHTGTSTSTSTSTTTTTTTSTSTSTTAT